MRLNRPITGFFIGLVMPFIGFLVVFAISREGMDLGSYLSYLADHHKDAARAFTFGMLANILPFMLLTNRRLDYGARGVFIATMLYCVVIILVRYVW